MQTLIIGCKYYGLQIVAGLILMSAPVVWAGHCQSDFDCDGDVYPSDLSVFLGEYGTTDCTSCPSQSTPCEGTLSPLGRWCDQLDGTVKDMTNGLVWLQDASCMGIKDWYDAIVWPIVNLRNGDCSGTLTDGSVWGDWRLPTITEFYNLANGTEAVRDSSMQFFTGVQFLYWSSTRHADGYSMAWNVDMDNGYANYDYEGYYCNVWPVRGGQ